MPLSTQNGFSEKEIGECKGWQLPEVSDGASALVKTNKKTSARLNRTSEQVNTEKPESIEVVEDVELEAIDSSAKAISAEELEKITAEAEKEGYQTGFEKGLEEGKKEGLATGLREGKQTIVEQSQRLQHIIDALLTPLENEQKQLEKLLVDMTCRLTKTLVERELKTDSSIITQHIDSVLRLLPKTLPAFTLFLSPNDIQLVEDHLEKTLKLEQNNNSTHYQLKADEALMEGGCRLESSHTNVDASMELKLANLLNSFVEKRHDKTPPELQETRVKADAIEDESADDGYTETAAVETASVDNAQAPKDSDTNHHRDE